MAGPSPAMTAQAFGAHLRKRRSEQPLDLPASSKPMRSAAGTRGRPGMVLMSPQMAVTKPAPAASRTSRTGRTWPSGAPRKAGSAEKLDCVLAMQHRELGRAELLEAGERLLDLRREHHFPCAIDLEGDAADLVGQRQFVGVERAEAARLRGEVDHGLGERLDAGRAARPMLGEVRLDALAPRRRRGRPRSPPACPSRSG